MLLIYEPKRILPPGPASCGRSHLNLRHIHFHQKELPLQVQFSPVFNITPLDFDKYWNEDILLCGNINPARIRFGKSDANYGTLLKGDGKGHFSYVDQQQSGFRLLGDVRSVLALRNNLLFGMNEGDIKAYSTK